MHGAVLPARTAIREMSRTTEESEGHFSLSVCGLFICQRKLHFPNQNEVAGIPGVRVGVTRTVKKTYCQLKCAAGSSVNESVYIPSAHFCTFGAFDCLQRSSENRSP
jgi:hypothetical protein